MNTPQLNKSSGVPSILWCLLRPSDVHIRWKIQEAHIFASISLRSLCSVQFSSPQSLSCVWLFATPWTAAHQASMLITTPRACSNSRPLSQWYHPTISFSVIPFSSCPQSFPASGSFPMSLFFSPGGQSIGVSASASVLPMTIQD